MKHILLLPILASALLMGGCAGHDMNRYKVHDNCLDTVIETDYSIGLHATDKLSIVTYKALQLANVEPTAANAELLGKVCSENPNYSFMEASKVVHEYLHQKYK